MRLRKILIVTLAATLSYAAGVSAALIVDPPRPITHRVTVQIIQTAHSNGTLPAGVFGSSALQADIESRIDMIWAQAGIDVAFLPNVVRYNDTFANQGNVLPRPATDLNVIMADAAARGGILNPDPHVINMFFVNVVPGANIVGSLWARGVGNVGFNGIAQFIGSDLLLGPDSNRDVIARVVSHEIGHNLGLQHFPAGTPNLMSTSATTSQLTGEQISTIFQTQYRNDNLASIPNGGTGFPQLLPAAIAGDYNRDGVVNAADYVLWRELLGTSTSLAADGNGNGRIDSGDYTVWRNNFGRVAPTGAAAFNDSANVPEPAAVQLLLLGVTSYLLVMAGEYRIAITASVAGPT